jgi:hypothetical protein
MVVKKILAAAAGALAVTAGLVVAGGSASAAAPDCQTATGYGVVVASAPVKGLSDGTEIGKSQLCRDAAYHYWAFVRFYSPLNASSWGQASLYRFRNGVQVSTIDCSSGNGLVNPGQTRCWTGTLDGLSGGYTFQAVGEVTSSHTGNVYAQGWTPITR